MTRRRAANRQAQASPPGPDPGRTPGTTTTTTDPYSWDAGTLSLVSTAYVATNYVMPTICPPGHRNAITHTTTNSGSTSGPSGPICMKGLAGAIGLFLHGTQIGPKGSSFITDPTKNYPDLIKNHPDVVNAIVSFTLSIKTLDQLKALEARLSPCRCDINHLPLKVIHAMESPQHGVTKSPSQALSRALFRFLLYLAQFTPGTLYRSAEKIEHRNKRDKALKEFSRYMLDDAQAALDSAFCWFSYFPTIDRYILSFVDECLARYHTFRSITPSSSAQNFIGTAAVIMHKQVVALPEGIALATTQDPKRWENRQKLKTYASFIGEFLSPDRPPPKPDVVMKIIYDTPIFFFHILEQRVDPVDRDFLKELDILKMIADIGIKTLMFVKGPAIDVTPMMKVFEYSPWGQEMLLARDMPYHAAWTQLISCFMEERCLNPECAKSPRGQKFSRCGGCGIPNYCSKPCQKASWAHHEFPHRIVCRPWSKLTKVWPLKPSQDDFRSLKTLEGKMRWNDKMDVLATSIGITEESVRRLGRPGFGNLKYSQRCYLEERGRGEGRGQFAVVPYADVPGPPTEDTRKRIGSPEVSAEETGATISEMAADSELC